MQLSAGRRSRRLGHLHRSLRCGRLQSFRPGSHRSRRCVLRQSCRLGRRQNSRPGFRRSFLPGRRRSCRSWAVGVLRPWEDEVPRQSRRGRGAAWDLWGAGDFSGGGTRRCRAGATRGWAGTPPAGPPWPVAGMPGAVADGVHGAENGHQHHQQDNNGNDGERRHAAGRGGICSLLADQHMELAEEGQGGPAVIPGVYVLRHGAVHKAGGLGRQAVVEGAAGHHGVVAAAHAMSRIASLDPNSRESAQP